MQFADVGKISRTEEKKIILSLIPYFPAPFLHLLFPRARQEQDGLVHTLMCYVDQRQRKSILNVKEKLIFLDISVSLSFI